jgi:hypothetical protein
MCVYNNLVSRRKSIECDCCQGLLFIVLSIRKIREGEKQTKKQTILTRQIGEK